MLTDNPITRVLLTLFLGMSCAAAQTIVTGDSDYVGDFTGVTIAEANHISGSQIGDGWVAVNMGWSVNASGQAERNDGDVYTPRGLAIAFAPPSFDGAATLSFDFDFSGNQANNNGGGGWALLRVPTGITSELYLQNLAAGFFDFSNDPDLAAYDILELIVQTGEEGNTSNETGTFDFSGTSGTISETVTLNNTGADGYIFAVFADYVVAPPYPMVDNVEVDDIPEPAAAGLLIAGAVALYGFRRRRH